MFFTREEYQDWEQTAARSVAGAKRAATAKQAFLGTRIQVAVKRGDTFVVVAERFGRGKWDELVPEWAY